MRTSIPVSSRFAQIGAFCDRPSFRAHRIHLIQDLRWDLGTTVLPKAIVENLHRLEMDFFNKYQNLLAVYMRSINGLDLTLVRVAPWFLLEFCSH
jgi:hypothetical protein